MKLDVTILLGTRLFHQAAIEPQFSEYNSLAVVSVEQKEDRTRDRSL